MILTSLSLASAVIATVLTVLDVLFLLVLVIWLLRLRQSAELIQRLLHLAVNLIGYVERCRVVHLLETQPSAVRDDFVCRHEEQEEFKQLLVALQQVGLRSLHNDQPVPAGMVVRAIKTPQL